MNFTEVCKSGMPFRRPTFKPGVFFRIVNSTIECNENVDDPKNTYKDVYGYPSKSFTVEDYLAEDWYTSDKEIRLSFNQWHQFCKKNGSGSMYAAELWTVLKEVAEQ